MAGVRPVSVPEGGVCGPAEDDRNIAACAILKQWVTHNLKAKAFVCGSYIHVQLEFASQLQVLECSRNTAGNEGP